MVASKMADMLTRRRGTNSLLLYVNSRLNLKSIEFLDLLQCILNPKKNKLEPVLCVVCNLSFGQIVFVLVLTMSTRHMIAFKPCFFTLDVVYSAILVVLDCN